MRPSWKVRRQQHKMCCHNLSDARAGAGYKCPAASLLGHACGGLNSKSTPVTSPISPCIAAYAMTEASHQMTSNPLPKHGPHKPGSVGRAQGSVKVSASALDALLIAQYACKAA